MIIRNRREPYVHPLPEPYYEIQVSGSESRIYGYDEYDQARAYLDAHPEALAETVGVTEVPTDRDGTPLHVLEAKLLDIR